MLYGIRNEHRESREDWKRTWSPTCRSSATNTTRKAYGTERFLTDEEIDDVAEYVMQISDQQVRMPAKAGRGRVLFMDRANCFDCHGDDAHGQSRARLDQSAPGPSSISSGPDRETVIETIKQGRRGTMPAFEGKLRPEELKAVSVFAFSRALKESNPLP